MASYQGYISGPKWAGALEALINCAHHFNLRLDIKNHQRGWLHETIFFEFTGDENNIQQSKQALWKIIEQYNAPKGGQHGNTAA